MTLMTVLYRFGYHISTSTCPKYWANREILGYQAIVFLHGHLYKKSVHSHHGACMYTDIIAGMQAYKQGVQFDNYTYKRNTK